MDTDTADASPAATRATWRRPRGRGIRVRTGCLACRQRHLKCDETQPTCRACQKAVRECTYPHRHQETDRQGTPSRSAGDEPASAGLQRQKENLESIDSILTDHHVEDSSAVASGTQVEHSLAHQSEQVLGTITSPSHRVEGRSVNGTEKPDTQIEEVTHSPLIQNQGQSVDHVASLYSDENATFLTDEPFGFSDHNDGIEFPDVYDPELFGISPEASFGGWPTVSAEAASRWWFDLLAADTSNNHLITLNNTVTNESYGAAAAEICAEEAFEPTGSLSRATHIVQPMTGNGHSKVILTDIEIQLVHHYVLHLSGWIDVTDPDRQFAVVVPDLAMRNQGLASAILALSSLHLSLGSRCSHSSMQIDPTASVQYYNETLHYLQQEMGNAAFLRSDELLATVLIISTFEIIETQTLCSAWDKHLKGVFWIQRSQTIHGESQGLKQRIWWSWLRQDIYAAFRRRRQILSFYKVTRACASLNFWELVDRAIYLLGQCVNYASTKEEEAGRSDVQRRLDDSAKMWEKLEEFASCFQKYDRRLPTRGPSDSIFKPIWINPAASSLAIQVHHFSKLLLLEYTPAIGGMRELMSRQSSLQAAVEVICGIASCTVDEGAMIISTQCVFAAGHHVQDAAKRAQVIELLQAHREKTGWPHYDISKELETTWRSTDGTG